MKATVLPEVTTRRFVCCESSIEVIGPGKLRLVVNLRVRRSHHLMTPSSPAVTPVWSPTQTTLLTVPSCEFGLPSLSRTSGSASGLLKSNIRAFFS